MLLLSVIIPIYNSEKWLRPCLESLMDQDLPIDEYEIVCVDDGSTDGSVAIIEKYQKRYSNIKLLQKVNGGVSSARNMGLDYACGKYIWFVDSDDLIRRNSLGFLKRIVIKHDPEIVGLPLEFVQESFMPDAEECTVFEYAVDDCVKAYNSVCSTIILSELINDHHIRFHTGLKYAEDTLFQYYVYMFRNGEKPSLTVNSSMYYYRQNSTSAMRHKSVAAYDKHVQDLLAIARIYQEDYRNKIVEDPEKLKDVKTRQHQAVEGALTILPKSGYSCNDTLKKLKEEGLYPYPMMWRKIEGAKGIQRKVLFLCRMLFGFEFFYKIYFALLNRKSLFV